MEKKNDLTTTEYYRGTNRKQDALQQMFDKRARCLFYRLQEQEQKPKSKTIERTERLKDFFKETDLFNYTMDQIKKKVSEIKGLTTEDLKDIETAEATSEPIDEPADVIDDNSNSENDETMSLDEFSDTDEENEERQNFIVYQIEDIKLMSNVIDTLRPKQCLNDDIIMAFMRCFHNKKKIILNYHKTTMLTQDHLIERDLFSNVIFF